MKQQIFYIDKTPAVLYGEKSTSVYLYLHGQSGNKFEGKAFAETAIIKGDQVLAIDLPEHGERNDEEKLLPWTVLSELEIIKQFLYSNWSNVSIRANSIGAWFSMLSFANNNINKCLFVSPVLDMEKLISDMMKLALVTENDLQQKREIQTDFGQTLSWDYLSFVRQNPITQWSIPTKILYASKDNLVQRETVEKFVERFQCGLSIMENGEHWFHTDEQLEYLKTWEEKMI